ncbi:pinin [Anopheles stephensi]|uniref:Pinin/SDK/MemA protein domain-containing protein n=1 Tax=Anopheles stephensi TaxID=30069 RepID=A0A182XXH9_ANOST|nr:pinin [Anopheles stephensi]
MMATEIVKGYNDLQQELDRARCNLKGLNDNIRRIFGRDPANAEQYNNGRDDAGGPYTPNGGNKKAPAVKDSPYDSRKRSSVGFDSPHHGMGPRRDHGRAYPDLGQNPAKRRAIGETKSVFSRLSGPPNRDVDYEKPRIFSRVIKEQPSKEDIVAAQGSDERSRARNRRIFGSLLGTLQKFSQEESKLKSKEEKKAMIEKKLEEQEKAERENMLKEKQCLFTDRKRQQLEIRALETKVAMLKALEMWENSKRPLQNFIKTKTNPPIYYLPKRMNAAMEKKLAECQQEQQKMMEEKRQEVMESIEAVEARFRADIKSLEENDTKDRSHGGSYERVKSSGSFDESMIVGSGGSKHDRSKLEDDEEDDDPHSSYHYEQDEPLEVPEGPALPASMASRFKITILNTEHKQDTVERREMPAEESKPMRLLSTDSVEVDASVTEMDEDSEGVSRRKTSLDRSKNIQITFRTSAPEDN